MSVIKSVKSATGANVGEHLNPGETLIRYQESHTLNYRKTSKYLPNLNAYPFFYAIQGETYQAVN